MLIAFSCPLVTWRLHSRFRTNSSLTPPQRFHSLRVPRGFPILTPAPRCVPLRAEEGREKFLPGSSGRGTHGARRSGRPGCWLLLTASPPGSPVLQREEPVPSGAGRRSGARGREERRSRAPAGVAAQLPKGLGLWHRGRGPGRRSVPWRGGVGGTGAEVGGRRMPRRAPAGSAPAITAACPHGLYMHCPLPVSVLLPASSGLYLCGFRSWLSPLSLESPPLLPSSFPPPSPGAACCLDFPGVASLRYLALRCNSGTHNQPGPLKPTAPLKSDPQV